MITPEPRQCSCSGNELPWRRTTSPGPCSKNTGDMGPGCTQGHTLEPQGSLRWSGRLPCVSFRGSQNTLSTVNVVASLVTCSPFCSPGMQSWDQCLATPSAARTSRWTEIHAPNLPRVKTSTQIGHSQRGVSSGVPVIRG